MRFLYADRHEAGRRLAGLLAEYAGKPNVVVLALPRGGVPVGFEVAQILAAHLDVYMVRKLGVPGHEELAMGAVAASNVRFMNDELVQQLSISQAAIDAALAREQQVLERQLKTFRGDRPPPEIASKVVILVDDGLATGATMAAAAIAVRQQKPARIVIAVPVAPPDTCKQMQKVADEVICAAAPEMFGAVGLWYEDFSPVTDLTVRALLERAHDRVSAVATTGSGERHAAGK